MALAEAEASELSYAADFGHLDVLTGMVPAHRRSVLEQCTQRHCKKGATLLKQGERADFVAFIGQGQAITLYHAPNGRVGASGIWTSGDVLGASYIHNPTTRHATVKSIEPVTLFCLHHAAMHRIMREYPDFSDAMIRAVSARLRWAHSLTHIMQTLPAFERVAALLVSLAERYGVSTPEGVLINVSLTHEYLGAFVGVTRQFATVTLHELEKQGLVSLRQRKIVVHDQKRLRRVASVF